MKQLFLMVNDGSVKLIDTPMPKEKENFVLVETLYTAVSAGTERGLTSFGSKNILQKALERPDQVKKITEKISTDGLLTTVDAAMNRLMEPMPMGYSGVGRIIECGKGVTEVNPGDMVAMAGQAYHSQVNRVNRNLIARIPEELTDYRQGAFCALGGVALQGIHQSRVEPGETVAVIGLGLLGHIVARILNAYGCDVIAYDVQDKSLPGTHLKAFILSGEDAAADITKALTKGRGVDKVIITAAANSNQPMDLAASIIRDRGTIYMIGVTPMTIDRRAYYEKELTFTIARSYGPGRYDVGYEEKGIDYPIGYVRFTEARNLEEFIRLLAEKRLDLSELITHEIDFEDADTAYEMITENKSGQHYIGVLLKYPDDKGKWADTVRINKGKAVRDQDLIRIGLIGAGNFARNTLLPIMKETGRYQFAGLATTGGMGAAQTQNNFSFSYATNDHKQLLEDRDIDLIAISTQHNTHARFIIEALVAGKHVYCEKPMCLNLDELHRIEEAYGQSQGELFIGLNRRHAPLIREIRKSLSTNQIPAIYSYTANVGFIPRDNWVQDEGSGGGRLIGEAIHFIDVIQFLDGSGMTSLDISYVDNEAYPCKDNGLITIKFASGAVASILYTSMGSAKFPKEELRVFSGGRICEMDNYLRMNLYSRTKKVKLKFRQDKGFNNEYQYIADVIRGKSDNTSIRDAFSSHLLLLESLQSCKKG